MKKILGTAMVLGTLVPMSAFAASDLPSRQPLAPDQILKACDKAVKAAYDSATSFVQIDRVDACVRNGGTMK